MIDHHLLARNLVVALCLLSPLSAQSLELKDVQLNLIDQRRIPVSEAGIVREIPVKVGDMIRDGEVLAQMDDRLLQVQREAAIVEAQVAEHETQNDTDLKYARKSYSVSKAEYDRQLQAKRQYAKSVSATELDQAKLVTERSELAAEQAVRAIEAAQLALKLRCKQVKLIDQRLGMMQIRSPFDGMVVEVFPKPGEFLLAGAPVARMIQLDRLRVNGFVDGRKYDQSLKGAPVTLTVKLPPTGVETKFSGEVTFVSPEMNPVTAQIRILVDIDNSDLKLRPGNRGQLSIALNGE